MFGRKERLGPCVFAIAGLAGCALLAFSLPWQSILESLLLLLAGAAVYAMRRQQRSSGAQR
jgi:basic amino acid/polyamine antiporter, APA family